MAPPLVTKTAFGKLLRAQVGKRYKLGKPNPYNAKNPAEFDCSGLAGWGLYWSGNDKKDNTAAGYWNMSKPSQPEVGAFVFLANHSGRKAPAGFKYGIGHMAVITEKLSNGDWEIIEARGTAAGVVRTTLSFWKKRKYYAGVRTVNMKFAAAPKPSPTPTPPKPPAAKPPTFPLPSKYYHFGPRSGDKYSVSGYMNRKFNGKTDNYWLKLWETEANRRGFKVKVNGYYDAETKAAAKAIQKKHKLIEDGLIGYRTWAATFNGK